MNNGIGAVNQFARVQTYTGIWASTGLALSEAQNALGASTYVNGSGLYYKTGAILAYDPGGDWVNCDPSALDSTATAVAILFDDHLIVSDYTGASVVGEITTGVIGSFEVDANFLFATLQDLTDVPAAMASMGARYIAASNTYRLF